MSDHHDFKGPTADADFGRPASRSEHDALKEAVAFAVRQPNEQFAYHRCRVCDGAWFGEAPGRKNPDRPSHRLDCPVPRWEDALAAAVSELQRPSVVRAHAEQLRIIAKVSDQYLHTDYGKQLRDVADAIERQCERN